MAIVVVFHMHGCPHCPPLLDACRDLRRAHVVEVEAQNPLVDQLGISSFPTLWLSTPKDVFHYTGPRTAADIDAWIETK
jgi:hypothetical protein